MRLRLENERLQSEVEQLRKLVGGGISDLEGASAVVDFDDPLRIQALEIELQHAKEALAGEEISRLTASVLRLGFVFAFQSSRQISSANYVFTLFAII